MTSPALGCLVKAQPVDDREAVYGLISNIHIDDDPLVRRLVLAESPQQAVIEDQRNNRLLPIEMSALAVGYHLDGQLQQGLPPRPPLNLDPVYLCQDPQEVGAFTERSAYLRLIIRASGSQVPVDQLLASHVDWVYRQRGLDVEWARRIIQELTELLRSEYDYLVPALEAISEVLPDLP